MGMRLCRPPRRAACLPALLARGCQPPQPPQPVPLSAHRRATAARAARPLLPPAAEQAELREKVGRLVHMAKRRDVDAAGDFLAQLEASLHGGGGDGGGEQEQQERQGRASEGGG